MCSESTGSAGETQEIFLIIWIIPKKSYLENIDKTKEKQWLWAKELGIIDLFGNLMLEVINATDQGGTKCKTSALIYDNVRKGFETF